MNPTVQFTVFVDGNNVMGARPDGWWRDRAKAARRLVAEIAPLTLGHGGAWTIVFYGQAPPEMASSPECLTVLHTGHGRRDGADDRIVELVRARRSRATSLVYTSDAALRDRVHALAGQVSVARALLNEIAALRAPVERPSPNLRRVGSCITLFEACSAFTARYDLHARRVPCGPSTLEASAVSLPPRPFQLLPAGTTVAGWKSHPLTERAFHSALTNAG